MTNRQTRSPGELRRYQGLGTISGDAQISTLDQGAPFRALEQVGGQLASRLMQLANQAAAREGAAAGLLTGQSGAGYLEARAVEERAAAGSASRQVNAPAHVREAISAAAKKYGVDPAALMRIAEIESSLNPNAKNPNSSAGGLFQFIDSTAAQYGLTNRYDPAQAADAGARLMKDNAAYLRAKLGREPTGGELYLAHQQGAGGAAKLLANPGAPAASIVGNEAIRLNGGQAGMTAGEFAGLWTRKAGGGAAANGATSKHYSLATLPTSPLQLRNDGTIYGEAYDRAAISAYGWRMQQGLSTDLANAHDEFRDDPGGFQKRLGDIRTHYLQDEALADPQVREAFDKAFANGSEAYLRDVADRSGKRVAAEQQQAMADGLEAQGHSLEKQAFLLGANPDGDRILADQLGRALTSIDHAVANGTMEPAQAAKARRSLEDGVARGRIQGVFEALDSPAKKEAYANSLLDDWGKGEGPIARFDFDTVSALAQTLRRDAQQLGNEQSAKNVFEKQRVAALIDDDVASMAATGKGLDLKESGLAPELVVAAVGEAKALEWQARRKLAGQTWEATAGMETQSEADMAARLAALEPKAGAAGFEARQAAFEAAQKTAAAVLKQRADDPAKAVEAAFPQVAALADAADPANPDSMQALVSARLQGQAALGISEFAREPLTKAEAMNLARAISEENDPKAQAKAMQALVGQVNAAYGPHGKAVLAQVLNRTGIDKDMAQAGARIFARLNAGQGASKAEQRAGGVAAEGAAADAAAKPSGQAEFPMPNARQQQMLLENPDMAGRYDEKFGPGAAQRLLGQRNQDPNARKVPGGTMTRGADGSEGFVPDGR